MSRAMILLDLSICAVGVTLALVILVALLRWDPASSDPSQTSTGVDAAPEERAPELSAQKDTAS